MISYIGFQSILHGLSVIHRERPMSHHFSTLSQPLCNTSLTIYHAYGDRSGEDSIKDEAFMLPGVLWSCHGGGGLLRRLRMIHRFYLPNNPSEHQSLDGGKTTRFISHARMPRRLRHASRLPKTRPSLFWLRSARLAK